MRMQQLFNEKSDDSLYVIKRPSYLPVYETFFSKYSNPTLLEIGVYAGGGLELYKNYFGECDLYGIDILPQAKDAEGVFDCHIFIGDAGDESFLQKVKNSIPKLDIIIDDCSHFTKQQIISFNALWSHLKTGGIYLCEDVYTNYWKQYVDSQETFVEHIMRRTCFGCDAKNDPVFTNEVLSVHFFEGIVVIEKGQLTSEDRKAVIKGKIV